VSGPAPSAFFVEEEGERFLATELTRGPWSTAHQHGGPPAALLARAIEWRLAAIADAAVVRFAVDFLKPIPLGPVAVRAEPVRAGRKVQELTATLRVGDEVVCRASALAVRRAPIALPPLSTPPLDAPPPPERGEPFAFPFFVADVGYHTAFDARLARGRFGTGAAAIWFRARYPLLAGEAPSPLSRVVLVADSGNGVSAALDTRRYTFVNPDLAVFLHRDAEGEWICLDARTAPGPHGAGVAETALFDGRGPIGRGLQSLLIEERSSSGSGAVKRP
jgi:hypothetical protein